MKRDKLWILAAAGVALVLAWMPNADSGILGALALPLTAVGWLLRSLSVSGGAGNALALVLFAVVSLLPLLLWKKLGWEKEDWLLAVLMPVVAFAVYLTVNPGMRPEVLQNDMDDILYAGVVWSVIVTWAVGKLLRRVKTANLYQALRLFLLICGGCCIVSGFGLGIARLRTQMVDPMILLHFGAEAAEQTLLAIVFWQAAGLMTQIERDPYAESTVAAGARVSLWCRRTLKAAVVMDLCLNLVQIVLAEGLTNIDISVRIPVLSMAICFGMTALTKLLVRGKELKDDNDLFI